MTVVTSTVVLCLRHVEDLVLKRKVGGVHFSSTTEKREVYHVGVWLFLVDENY